MIRVFFTLAAALVLLSGCGDDTPSFNEVVGLANGKITKVADMIQSGDSRRSVSPLARAAIGTVWTTANGVNALANGGVSTNQETLQDWIGHMFDETFENENGARVTFAGRIYNELQVLCFIASGGVPVDGTGLPADGTHTLTLTAAAMTACGDTGGGSGSTTVELTVSTLADTTIYTKQILAELPGQEACPFKFLVKNDGADLNLAGSEDQTCDSRNQASGSVFRYNAASQTTRFTYVSQSMDGSGGFEFYRGFLNEATDEAYVLGIYSGMSSANTLSNHIAFTAAGKPVASETVALSVRTNSQPNIGNGDYDGCIDSDTGAVAPDNTLTCTLTGTAINTAFTVINAELASNTAIADIYNIGATTDVGFTSASDIYTATRR